MAIGNDRTSTSLEVAIAELPKEYTSSGLAKVIRSIIDVVDEETACLATNRPLDVAGTNCRKARLLHEFNLAARAIESFGDEHGVTKDLRHMHMALQKNARQCKAHAAAVREIVDIAFDALCEQESDGTYKRRAFREF